MKVLHLTTYSKGGAGIAAGRLAEALRTHCDCTVEFLYSRNDGITSSAGLPFFFRLKRKAGHLLCCCSKNTNPNIRSLGLCSSGLVKTINQSDADIVHLHWINEQFLSIRDLTKIKKPLIWTQHDSWSFCGTEHHPNLQENDLRWKEGYLKSNFPASSSGIDLDRWIWLWKKHCWKDLDVTLTAPSTWESSLVSGSALFKNKSCHTIPNCIDTQLFVPEETARAKQKWGIAPEKRVILFGAAHQNDPVKGGKFLYEALKTVCRQADGIVLMCFGANFNGDLFSGTPCINAGSVSGDAALAAMYQAADVFVCPSIVESFSLTSAEAAACELPTVTFNTGGVTDVVKHKKTGYLAEPYSTDDLAQGILYALENRELLGKQARIHAVEKFDSETVAHQFEELYRRSISS